MGSEKLKAKFMQEKKGGGFRTQPPYDFQTQNKLCKIVKENVFI